MAVFTNSFFSIAGQKERLANVASVLNIAFNPLAKGKVVANVPTNNIAGTTLKNVLEFGANNPYTTAGLVTGGIGAAKSLASGSGSVLKGIASVAKANPFKTSAALVATGAALTSTKVQNTLAGVVSHVTPEGLIGTGASIGRFITTPNKETGKELAKDVGVTGAVVAAGLIAATGLIPKAIDLITGDGNDKTPSTPSTPSIPAIPTGTLPTPTGNAPATQQKAVTPETQVISAGTTKKKKGRPKYTKKNIPSVNQRVNVIVSNRSSSVGIKQTKKYLNKEVLLN